MDDVPLMPACLAGISSVVWQAGIAPYRNPAFEPASRGPPAAAATHLHDGPSPASEWPMSSPRIIVFDLDGTLVDTAPDLIAALNFVLTAKACSRCR